MEYVLEQYQHYDFLAGISFIASMFFVLSSFIWIILLDGKRYLSFIIGISMLLSFIFLILALFYSSKSTKVLMHHKYTKKDCEILASYIEENDFSQMSSIYKIYFDKCSNVKY